MSTKKLLVEKLPVESMIYAGVYLPSNHALANKYVKVTSTNNSCTTSGVYFAKPSDKVTGLALSQKQRNYLVVYDGEQCSVEECDINSLPVTNVYLTMTLKSANANPPTKDHIKDIKVVNIGEIVVLLTGSNATTTTNADVHCCVTCLCGCDTIKGKQAVKVGTITVNTLADVRNSLLGSDVSSLSSFNNTNNKLVSEPIVTNGHGLIPVSTFQMQTLDFDKSGVGGLSHQVETIFRRIFLPYILGQKGEMYGLKPCRGVLLHGPSGVGKTALARGLAVLLNEDAVVTLINGPELLNKFVGQSEENVRKLYAPARKDPSKLHVFIFDEFDSLAKRRGASGREHSDSVLNQLLTEMDGVNALNNVINFALTNRKDQLDDAVLRPGRFDVHLYIGLPDQKGREEIFTIHAKDLIANKHIDVGIISQLAKRMANFTGAEIESVIKNTKTLVVRKHIDINNIKESVDKLPHDLQFTIDDFVEALNEIQPMFGSRYYPVPSDIHEHLTTTYDALCGDLSTGPNNKNILLVGKSKSGKTVMGKRVLNDYRGEYKYYLGGRDVLGETKEKVELLRKIFTSDTKAGVIVIDNIEILLSISYNYYDQQVLQTLLLLMNEKQHNVLILGCKHAQLQQLGITDEIDTTYTI